MATAPVACRPCPVSVHGARILPHAPGGWLRDRGKGDADAGPDPYRGGSRAAAGHGTLVGAPATDIGDPFHEHGRPSGRRDVGDARGSWHPGRVQPVLCVRDPRRGRTERHRVRTLRGPRCAENGRNGTGLRNPRHEDVLAVGKPGRPDHGFRIFKERNGDARPVGFRPHAREVRRDREDRAPRHRLPDLSRRSRSARAPQGDDRRGAAGHGSRGRSELSEQPDAVAGRQTLPPGMVRSGALV